MRILTFTLASVLAVLTVAFAGCGKKTDTESALSDAVKAMEQPESGQQPAPETTPPPRARTPGQPPAASPPPPAQQMNQAVAAYKAGNYVDAVTRLQSLRSQKATTPQQLLALQEATAAVMGEIYTLAAKGDARAKQAVKEYERLQNAQ